MKSFISSCNIDEILYNIDVPGNLNSYSIDNPLYFPVNSYNIFTSLPLVPENPGASDDSWFHFLKGGGFIATSIFAIVAAVSIFVCPVASPLLIGVGVVTAGAGVATGINGAAEIQEGFTGDNFVRDDWFGGNQTAYNWYSFGTSAVATVGTIWIGGWMSYNQPRIQAYKNVGKAEFPGNYYLENIGSRPYFDSILTHKQIIKYGEMTSKIGKNGKLFYIFTSNGSFGATVGSYELNMTSNYQYLWHLLFTGV